MMDIIDQVFFGLNQEISKLKFENMALRTRLMIANNKVEELERELKRMCPHGKAGFHSPYCPDCF